MQATYQISEADYVAAARLFSKLTSKWLAIYLVLAVILVLLAALSEAALRAAAIGGVIGGFIGGLMMHYIIVPIQARRHYRKYKAMHATFTIELLESGVRLTSPNAQGIVRWDQIHKWRQNDVFVLIYPMPRLYHIIPKSIAAQGFDVAQLTQALKQSVGQSI